MIHSIKIALFVVFLALIVDAGQPPRHQADARSVVTSFLIQADRGSPDVKVWVNTNSGVYHCPGTKWYGKTKNGLYMTQAEAEKKGYRPAYGKVCH